MKEIKGIIPIVAAPFTKQGEVDEDSFQHLVRHLLTTGVQGLTLFGVATEFHKLTDAEKERMQTILLTEMRNHPTVVSMVSITDHAREIAVKRAQRAEEMGADSLMLLPPFFLKPSMEAIITHIKAVASSVSIPIVVQYAPNQTGVTIPADVFLRLKEDHDNIKFVKVEPQPPGRYVSELVKGSDGSLGALVGYAGIQMPDVFKRGAKGIQPGCSFSEIYVELYKRYETENKDAFTELFNQLLPYISYWMQGSELIIQAEKTILYKRGIIASDYCREPAHALDSVEIEMIEEFLSEFKDYLSLGQKTKLS